MDMKKKLSNKGEAKLNVLKDLRKTASEAMGEGIKGIRKVTVAADSKEDLTKGLEMAKKLASKDPKELSEMADKEKMEEVMGMDLEGDEEEGESEEHKEEVLGEEEDESEDDSMDSLDKKIEELLKKKQALKMKA